MPIKIAYRRTYHENSFRDAILESLQSHVNGSVYIASGFFTNFLQKEQKKAPNHNLLSALSGKTVFLFGTYNKWRDKSSMISFKNTLADNGVTARAFLCSDKWHAKTLLFYSDNKPLLGIIGSSNTTGPSFSGYAPYGIWRGNPKHTVECDSYLWTSAIDNAINAAFGHLATRQKCYLSSSAIPDHEVERLINELLDELLKFTWEEL